MKLWTINVTRRVTFTARYVLTPANFTIPTLCSGAAEGGGGRGLGGTLVSDTSLNLLITSWNLGHVCAQHSQERPFNYWQERYALRRHCPGQVSRKSQCRPAEWSYAQTGAWANNSSHFTRLVVHHVLKNNNRQYYFVLWEIYFKEKLTHRKNQK